jgi:hypothetical protein
MLDTAPKPGQYGRPKRKTVPIDPAQLVPTRTAAAIARIRASEATLPAHLRLFDDPFARYFDDVHAEVEGVFAQAPFLREQVRPVVGFNCSD